MAQNHLKATSVNEVDPDVENLHKLCKCCGRNYRVNNLSIFSSIDKLYHLGTAYPFFFKMLIFFMIIFILGFLFYGIIAIIKMPSIIKCSFKECDHEIFFSEYENAIYFTHSFAIGSLVVFIIAKFFFALHLKNIELREDKNLISINDFTLYVSGLDQNLENKEIMKIFRENYYNYFNVVKVNKIYDISLFVDLLTEYLQMQKQMYHLKKMHEDYSDKYSKLSEKFNILHKKIENLKQNFNSNKFTGSAFITFNTEDEMQSTIKFYKKSLLTSKYKVKRATQPSDVIWENYGLSKSSKILRRLLSITIALILITLCFFLLIFIKKIQSKYNDEKNNILVWIYSIIISIIITILNYLLRISLYKTTEFEKRPSFSGFEISIVWKISFAQFLNSGVVLLIGEQIVNGNDGLYDIDGAANNMLVIMGMNTFSNALSTFFDPFYFFKLFKRYFLERKMKSEEEAPVFQYEVQEVFEKDDFGFELVNYTSFKTLSISLFFMPIIPFGLVFGILEIFFNYFVWKWILVYRSKIPKELGFFFTRYMIKLFELNLIIMALGYLTFDLIILHTVNFLTIILLVISILQSIFLQADFILKKKGDRFHDKTYEESKYNFPNEYDRLNPVTQRKAYHDWLETLGIINKEDKNQNLHETESSENILKSISDMINNKYKSGNGKNNLFQTKNPFIEKKKEKFENIIDSMNLYKIEENAYNQNREEKYLLEENKENEKYGILINKENDKINTNYNIGFYSALKNVYDKISINEKKETGFFENYGDDEENEDELLMEHDELAIYADIDLDEDIGNKRDENEYQFYD